MASAVVGFMNVFQTDEPAGCYADIDRTDVFVTWGANMAEAHPMLYSRLTARKLADEAVRHYDVTTMTTRTSASADKVLTFRPNLANPGIAIANAIANYLVVNDKVRPRLRGRPRAVQAGHREHRQRHRRRLRQKSDIGQAVDNVEPITRSRRVWPLHPGYASEAFRRAGRGYPGAGRCSPTRAARCSRFGPWA